MNSIVNWSGVGENVKAGRYRFVIPSDQEICTSEVSITQRKQFHRGQRNICEVEAPAGPRMCDDLVSSGIGTKASRLAKRRDSNSIHKAQDRTSQAVRTGLENHTPEHQPSGANYAMTRVVEWTTLPSHSLLLTRFCVRCNLGPFVNCYSYRD